MLMNTSSKLATLSGRTLLCATSQFEDVITIQTRQMGRRQPKQGKPPILPPAKKVLYHVVNAPWQKPEDVEELLWRRHAYNNAIVSLREVFRAELAQNASHGAGIEAMKDAESRELDELIAENEKVNEQKRVARAQREESDAKATKSVILDEIHAELEKRNAEKKAAEAEVRAAIARADNFVSRENLETKILEALEKPTIYDFAIDRAGNRYYVPEPVKYQEGTPTRQKGRLYDQTLGTQHGNVVEANKNVHQSATV
uniref:Small ribosomal subunit protein mS26 n=2 Tax=Caenorhabditis japonica TaxID=281687 RepID=A0A8R1IF22_CAEJA